MSVMKDLEMWASCEEVRKGFHVWSWLFHHTYAPPTFKKNKTNHMKRISKNLIILKKSKGIWAKKEERKHSLQRINSCPVTCGECKSSKQRSTALSFHLIKWLYKPQDAASPACRPFAHDLLFYSTEFRGVRYLRKTLHLNLEETTALFMNGVRCRGLPLISLSHQNLCDSCVSEIYVVCFFLLFNQKVVWFFVAMQLNSACNVSLFMLFFLNSRIQHFPCLFLLLKSQLLSNVE